MVPAVPQTVEQSVIPTAKSTPVLAAQAMAGVETRMLIVEPDVSLDAPQLLLPQIPLLLDLTVVAALLSEAQPATPMALTEAVAPRTGTAGRRPITVVQDARAGAQIPPADPEGPLQRLLLHLPALPRKSLFLASRPLLLVRARLPLTGRAVPQMATLSAATGRRGAAALPMVYILSLAVIETC